MGAYMNRILALGIVALAVTACGEGGTTAPAAVGDTVVAPAVTAAPSTTAAPVATTTTAPAPAATTTVPATTTTVATEDLIKQAVQDYLAAFLACGQAPQECRPESFTARAGHSRATVQALAAGMAREGLYFPADPPSSYSVPEEITVTSPTEATGLYCTFDAGAVMGPTGPDGAATVVNDEALSYRNEFHAFLEDGKWKIGEQLQRDPLGEGNKCPAA